MIIIGKEEMNKMKNKSMIFMLLIFIITIMFTLSGCIQYDKPTPTPSPDQEEGEEKVVVDPKPKGENKEITLYFMDKSIIETGQGDYSKLIKETRTIMVDDRPIEQIILEELQNGPKSEEATTMFRKELQIISVEEVDGTAYVNLSSQNLQGGSLEETGILFQVGYSLTELDNIDKVQFLVDGTKRETLFGHYEIQEPWSRNMLEQ